ncbi:hypothetical protein N0V83_009659 [Neocucurbitaria cava]|uniref:Uncharacterized protein n=1 Tax=Neocucurbitaria cava TaxID=798079 RepID=A0A9W8XYX8_9PLEO|nr:hypothetical protein N0V83_009659 [Neocucurbitaria cava]
MVKSEKSDIVTSSSAVSVTSSTSSQNTVVASKAKGVWEAIKRHHKDMNQAFEIYYGQGQLRDGRKQEVWEYKRGGRN